MRKYRAVFVDVTEGKLLKMLPNKSKESVKHFIKSLPDYRDIQCFTIDMWKPYKTAVYELIPEAIVIVDRKEMRKCVIYLQKSILNQDVLQSKPKVEKRLQVLFRILV